MINDIREAIAWLTNDSAAMHAAMVHLPIAGIGLGMLFALAAAVTGFRSRVLTGVAAATFILAAAGAGLAAGAGEESLERLLAAGPASAGAGASLPVSAVERAALDAHAELGEGGWLKPLIPAVLLAVCAFTRRRVRITAGVLGIAAAIFAMVWVVQAAHSGGELVYRHGLGVPARAATELQEPQQQP